MPQLKNPRHELMAQGLAAGKKRKVAYLEAGYTGNAEAVKAITKKHPQILARVKELQAAMAEQTVKAGADVINDLWAIADNMKAVVLGARAKKGLNRVSAAQAATQAYVALGRHYSLWEGADGNREPDSIPLAERIKRYNAEAAERKAIADSGGKVVPLIQPKTGTDADD